MVKPGIKLAFDVHRIREVVSRCFEKEFKILFLHGSSKTSEIYAPVSGKEPGNTTNPPDDFG